MFELALMLVLIALNGVFALSELTIVSAEQEPAEGAGRGGAGGSGRRAPEAS